MTDTKAIVTDEQREKFKTDFVQRMVTAGGLLLEKAEEQLPGDAEIDSYILDGETGEERADEEMSCWEDDSDSDDTDD